MCTYNKGIIKCNIKNASICKYTIRCTKQENYCLLNDDFYTLGILYLPFWTLYEAPVAVSYTGTSYNNITAISCLEWPFYAQSILALAFTSVRLRIVLRKLNQSIVCRFPWMLMWQCNTLKVLINYKYCR